MVSAVVSSQEPPATRESLRIFPGGGAQRGSSASGDPSIAGFFAWTLVVLGLIAAGTFVLRRAMKSSALFRGQGPIEIVSRRSIGPRQDLVLVKIGPRVLLVGATRDRLSLLGEFGAAPVAAAAQVLPDPEENRVEEAFAQS